MASNRALLEAHPGWQGQLAEELLDALPDAVLACDARGRIEHWNQAAQHLFGFDRGEALGQSALSLLTTRLPRPPLEIVEEVVDLGGWKGELIHRRRDGSACRVESRWVARYDLRARFSGTLRIERPLDEIEREPQPESTQPAAPQPLGRRAVHELNNALAIVVNYSAFVGSDLERLGREVSDARLTAARRDLQEVEAAAARASALLARLSAGTGTSPASAPGGGP